MTLVNTILFWGRKVQSIEGAKLFKSENLANFGIQTSINTFFGDQCYESKNSAHICVQTYMITFFWHIKFLNVLSYRLGGIACYFLLVA